LSHAASVGEMLWADIKPFADSWRYV